MKFANTDPQLLASCELFAYENIWELEKGWILIGWKQGTPV